MAAMDKFTKTTESCGGKGTARPLSQGASTSMHLRAPRPLSQEKNALTLALTSFYFFSGPIPLRMVLIYYAQVRFRWLPFTENKGEIVANYIKKEGYLQM